MERSTRPETAPARGATTILIATTILAYFVLYSPQPLLPFFQRRFEAATSQITLLISVTMLPLSLAPLLFGKLLAHRSPIRLLRPAVGVLAASEVAFVLADSLWVLIAIRAIQGLVLPAVLTSITTYLATTARRGELRRTMATYVASTIVGGYTGRLVSSLVAAALDWRLFYLAVTVGLLVCLSFLRRVRDESTRKPQPSTLRDWTRMLGDPSYLTTYVSVFCLFFVFAGLLNFLPFRTEELSQGSPGRLTGAIYTGYALGVGTSLGSGWIVRALGSDRRVLVGAYSVFLAALLISLVPNLWSLFAALFFFCGAMFLVHAVSTGIVNQIGRHHKGMVNGCYMAFYYGGGVLGSYLPGFIYERSGWLALVLVYVSVAAAGLTLVATRSTRAAGS